MSEPSNRADAEEIERRRQEKKAAERKLREEMVESDTVGPTLSYVRDNAADALFSFPASSVAEPAGTFNVTGP